MENIKFGGSLTNIDIAAGDVNIGNVDVASIAAGDNNIGNVDIASIAAGENYLGKVGGDITLVSITPVVTAGAYHANDIVGGTCPSLKTKLEKWARSAVQLRSRPQKSPTLRRLKPI